MSGAPWVDAKDLGTIGLTPAERDAWEQSALEWLDRASVAEIEGRDDDAATARTVAGIAAHVACGRRRRP